MSPNQILVRNMIAVMVAIAAITTLGLLLGQPAPLPRSAREPSPRTLPRLEQRGEKLYATKGCNACHTIDGTPRVGPTFLHDYGQQITLADGVTLRVDEAYLRESILHPQAQARPGYPPSMPTFDARVLTPRELDALVAFIKSLR